jgi:DNA-3-methyladenine glycosylase
MHPLKQTFFSRDTLTVARKLLGTKLVREFNGTVLSGMITETEAYLGTNDSACHASKGRTPRNSVMFGPAGIAYVYLVYGLHFMLNIVTEQEGNPCAVLIRAIKPIDGLSRMQARRGIKGENLTNGPAKVCSAMAIDKTFNGWDLTKGRSLWLERCKKIPAEFINCGPRIGIDYATQEHREADWRFWLKKGE